MAQVVALKSKTQWFRQMAHDKLDQWLDAYEQHFEHTSTPTLSQLSQFFTDSRPQLFGALLQKAIDEHFAPLLDQPQAPCPRCGKACRQHRKSTKALVTLNGPVQIERAWFYCKACRIGFCPLDQLLEVARQHHQFDVQQKALKLAARMPFDEASEVFKELTGLSLSDHCIHENFQATGFQASIEDVIPAAEQIIERIDQAKTGKRRPIMVVAADGAHMPTRPKAGRSTKRGSGSWQEAKGFRIYLLGPNKRIIQLASWHQIQDHEQFGKDLALVAGRIPCDKVRIALLGDGADWLWNHMTRCFPQGQQVLDFYHCSEHLHAVAKAQYGENSPQAFQWVEATICRLYFGEAANVIQGLGRMKTKDQTAAEQIRKLIGYFRNNAERIDYGSFRKKGFPIGSGGIESANKFICHSRMKRSGAWWVKQTGNAMLRLRCALYNGTFDKVFESYKKKCLEPKSSVFA